MKRPNVLLKLAGAGIASLLFGVAANASGTAGRAFVSITGVDNPSCSTASPCRTFGAALAALAADGEIVVQTSGGYGPFTINQSVTIDAAGVNASITAGTSVDGRTINASGARVVLRGISFHGGNAGHDAINVTSVGTLYVEHCSITEFENDGVDMIGGGNLYVVGSDFRACGSSGIDLETSTGTAANLVANDSRFAECNNGVMIKTSGAGGATGLLSDCDVSLSTINGYIAISSGAGSATMNCTNCRAIGNLNGFEAVAVSTGNGTVVMTNCVSTQNNNGVFAMGGGSGTAAVIGASPGSNIITGNGMGNTTTGTAVTQQ